jgi:hypothetical protein
VDRQPSLIEGMRNDDSTSDACSSLVPFISDQICIKHVMQDLQMWTETLVVLAIIAIILCITWAFKQRKEAFTEDPGRLKPASPVDYEIFFTIVNSYKTVLDRPPSEAEIQMQKARLSDDKDFTVMKMEASLRQSAEYQRLVALQKNTVFADLEGLLTERQLIDLIKTRYAKVAGHEPDDKTLEFLLDRYRKSQLDDVYLQALIENVTMTPMAASGYVGPGGPGGARGTGGADGKGGAGGADGAGGDASASARLFAILGLDEATIKRVLSGDDAITKKALEDARRLKEQDGAAFGAKCPVGGTCSLSSTCAANPAVADMSPDQVCDYVKDGAQRAMRAQACNYAKVKRAQELADAGMKEGKAIGSWTMPVSSRTPVCIGGGAVPRAVSDQSALIGTLLTDGQDKHPDMVLFD